MIKNSEDIKVLACSLTDKIYAMYTNSAQDISTDKIDVTAHSIVAVMMHMNRDKEPREITCSRGTLRWIPNKDE